MRIFFTFSLLLVLNTFMYAQQNTITGVVTSGDDGLPLPGVSVVVTGSTLGTITDIDGIYSLDIPEASTMLTFSFIGMESQDVALEGRNKIDVILLPKIMLPA